jgi:hypothetical protein
MREFLKNLDRHCYQESNFSFLNVVASKKMRFDEMIIDDYEVAVKIDGDDLIFIVVKF